MQRAFGNVTVMEPEGSGNTWREREEWKEKQREQVSCLERRVDKNGFLQPPPPPHTTGSHSLGPFLPALPSHAGQCD